MLNHITIMGRLARDPELRRTGSGVAVASFTVGVERDFADSQSGKKEMDWIECVAWRNTGEFVSKYFRKGNMIVVSGRLQIRSWTDKEGNKRKSAEIVADNCYFGGSKNDSTQGESNYGDASSTGYSGGYTSGYGQQTQSQYGGYSAPTGPGDYALLEDDDGELPF